VKELIIGDDRYSTITQYITIQYNIMIHNFRKVYEYSEYFEYESQK